MRMLLSTLAFGALAFAGCKKDHPQCEAYVDLATRCDAELEASPADEKDTAKLVLGGMCEEAFKNDTSDVEGDTKQMVSQMYASIRDKASCTARATTCEQYEKCMD